MDTSNDIPTDKTASSAHYDWTSESRLPQQKTTVNNPRSASTTKDSASKNERQDPPVKIRKKPGRKPNPASPALRKAQNRAAQRAFRERKERHMKELETNVRAIKEQRDELLLENEQLSNENELLKAENWYLKGIVLSLQLVCLQHNLSIPQHCPHVNDQTLTVLAQSIPNSIASYMSLKEKNELKLSDKVKRQHAQYKSSDAEDAQFLSTNGQPSVTQNVNLQNTDSVCDNSHANVYQTNNSNLHSSNPYLQDIPSLTPIRNGSTEEFSTPGPQEKNGPDENMLPAPQPTIANEPVSSNLAALQILRMRLRFQCAKVPFTIRPTLLQLTVPHDPRIDLVPTPQMRDRMILFKDQFDLDDCFRCLLAGSVFHGGDPAVAGNWQLPAEFFDKYWFLTTDYNLRRCTNEWRKKQGLKEIQMNVSASKAVNQSSPPMQTTSPPLGNPMVEANQYFNQPSYCSQRSQSSSTQFSGVADHVINPPRMNEAFNISAKAPLYTNPSILPDTSAIAAVGIANDPMNISPNLGSNVPTVPQLPFQAQPQPQSHSTVQTQNQTQPQGPEQLQNNWDSWILNSQGTVSGNLQQNFL